MSRWAATKYKTTNWSSCNGSLDRSRSGLILLWNGCRCRAASAVADSISAMPIRQKTGLVQSLLRLAGLGWTVPDFSTLCRRQRSLNVSLPYRGGTGPLNLLISSRDIAAQCPAGQ